MTIRTSVDGCRSFIGTVDECIDGFVEHHYTCLPTRGRIPIRRRKTTTPPTFSKSIDTELRKLKNKSAKRKQLLPTVHKDLFDFDLTKHMQSLNLSINSNGFSNSTSSATNNTARRAPSKQSSIVSFLGSGQHRRKKRINKNKIHKNNNSNIANSNKDQTQSCNKNEARNNNDDGGNDGGNDEHHDPCNEQKKDEPTRCKRKMTENTCYLNTCCQFLGNIPGFGEACIKHNDKTDDTNLQAWRQENEEQVREHPICYSSNHNQICTAINACAVGNQTLDLSHIMKNIESFTPSNGIGYDLRNGRQCDMRECLSMILYSDGYMSYVSNSLVGIKAKNVVRCKYCKHESSQIVYYDMYVPKQSEMQDGMSISSLWRSENCFVDAPDGYKCAKCKKLNVCVKKSTLTPLRDDIIIVLPRFKESENGQKIKNRALIQLDDLNIPNSEHENDHETL